jgi:hypothetical protein
MTVTLEDRVATEIAWWHLHGGNLGTQTKKIIAMCEADRGALLSVLRQCAGAMKAADSWLISGTTETAEARVLTRMDLDAALAAAAPYLERKEVEK